MVVGKLNSDNLSDKVKVKNDFVLLLVSSNQTFPRSKIRQKNILLMVKINLAFIRVLKTVC
ncbi:MAG: hypothetical protein I3273_06675 [Candidatus Moeniiplasma glomeromycotorum]|nr:hypothetical protein [Candidatus Moeniiplasma glomeromycotorum]MCE8169769.1 hypothetical protein [Candidatus Moeniiplasma glomeromycotorum]